MTTNKRLVLTGPKNLVIQEEPIPCAPGKGLVIKTHYTGVCHTDAHLWEDKFVVDENLTVSFTDGLKGYKYPIVMGHEIAGEVYEIGEDPCQDAPDVKVGDHVLIYPYAGCEACGMCKAREYNMCDDSLPNAYGLGKNGGHQGYVVICNRRDVIPLPESVDIKVANMLTCSALTAYNAVSKIIPALEEATKFTGAPRLLIVGAGGLGLWAVQWAKALCPPSTKVYVADITENKLEGAKELGADEGVLWAIKGNSEEEADKVIKQCEGKVDATIDFVGNGSTAERSHKITRNGGTLALVGIAGGSLRLSIADAAIRMINVCGVYVGNPRQLIEVMNYVAEKKVRPPPVHVFKPEQCEELIKLLLDGKLQGRGVLDFTGN